MARFRERLGLTILLVMAVAVGVAAPAPVWAQGADGWSFIVTPQVWVSHVALNGFSPPSKFYGFFPTSPAPPDSGLLVTPLASTSSSPVDDFNPQWGLQIAAQKGRWTIAGSFQYATFETLTTLTNNPPNGFSFFGGGVPGTLCLPNQACVQQGQQYAQEFVNTTRMDMDLAASYLFP